MKNYCFMAGQIISSRCFPKCQSLCFIHEDCGICLDFYDWIIFFGPSSELAAVTVHLPGCRCTMSQHKLDELSHHGRKPGTGLNHAWCTELEPTLYFHVRQGLEVLNVCMGCKHKNSAFHHSIQNVVHGALYLWLKILIVQEAEFDSTAVGIRSNCIIFWAWKGEKGSGQMCSV